MKGKCICYLILATFGTLSPEASGINVTADGSLSTAVDALVSVTAHEVSTTLSGPGHHSRNTTDERQICLSFIPGLVGLAASGLGLLCLLVHVLLSLIRCTCRRRRKKEKTGCGEKGRGCGEDEVDLVVASDDIHTRL